MASNYAKRKKMEREAAQASQNQLRNVNGQTYDEWKAGKKSSENTEIRNALGQTYDEYKAIKEKGEKPANKLETWKSESQNLIKSYDDYSYSGKYQTQDEHDDFYEQISKKLVEATSLRGKYKDNTKEIDDIVAELSMAIKDNEEGREYYSQWEDDTAYQEFLKYYNATEEPEKMEDFQKESDYEEPKGIKSLFRDSDYEYINDTEWSPKYLQEGNGDVTSQERKGYNYITDEERKKYNYIYNSLGKKEAEKYLEELNLTQRMADDVIAKNEEYATAHPVIASAKSVARNVLGGGMGYAESVANKALGKDIDENSYANLINRSSSAIRETVSDNIDSEAGKFFYQTGMSMADSVAAMAATAWTGPLGLAPGTAAGFILGSNAATSAMLNAKERGVTDGQALATGLAQGAAEMFFEKFSLGNLEALKDVPVTSLKSMIGSVLKQAGIEGSEEVFTSIANSLTDLVINRDLAENELNVQNYVNQGYTLEEASAMGAKDQLRNLFMDFLGGAVSGGVMGGGASALNYAMNRNQTTDNLQETETENTETETLNEETEEVVPETEETIQNPEEIPWEEAQMYEGEAQNTEVAPAQFTEESTQETTKESETVEPKKLQSARETVDTVLQYGTVDDVVASDIAKNKTIKKAFEEKTGVKITGTEAQQRNTVKEVVRVYAETHGNTTQNTPVATSASQNATVKGKGVEIIGVKSLDGSNPKFEASDGKTYSAEEVSFEENANRKLYADASKLAIVAGDETANSFVKNYKSEYNIAAYSWGFDALYKAGRNGVPLQSALKAADYAVQYTDAYVMTKAWELGAKAKKAEDSKVKVEKKHQNRKGKGTFTDETRQGGPVAEIARLVADRTGIDIVRKARLDRDANAAFVPSTMTMLLSENAENEYTSLIHELGEFGLSYNRDDMKQVQEAIIRWWAENNGVKGMEDLDTIIKKYQRVYAKAEGSKTTSQSIDEMINDALGGLFSTDTGADQFVQWLQKESGYNQTEQRTIIQRVIDMIDNVVKYLKNVIKDSALSRAAREAAQMEEKRANEIRRMFLDALEGAVKTANTTGEYSSDTRTKFSIKEIAGEKENYGQGVCLDTKFFDKVPPRKWGEKLRKYVYENLAGTELTVYDDGKPEVIYLAKKNDRVRKEGANNSHKVIDKLARSRMGDNTRLLSIVHIDELSEVSKYTDSNTEHTHQWMDENGWEFRTAYVMDKSGKIYEMTLNIAKGKERNILYDINKIKEIDHGDVASKGLAHKNQSLKDNISQKTKNATHEMKYSLKVEEDSRGNGLSEQQIKYFKYSKVRSKDGRLKVMYHGSPAQFTVFDQKKAKSSGYYGRGFYFTESSSHAAQYGSQYEVYLNLKNPLQLGTKNITKQQLMDFVTEIAENEDYGIENYGYGATTTSVVADIFGKDDFDMLLDLNATCVGDMVETVKLFNEVNGTDYDGIIAPTETVAFYPEQIKKTDNITPTDNEDIRFSLPADIDAESSDNLISSSESYQELTDNIAKRLKNQKSIEITEAGIKNAAEKMSKKYKSVADSDSLIKDIGALFRNMASAGTKNTGNFIYLAENIVRPMIEQSKNNLKINDSSKQILNDIKSKRIKLDKIQADEAAHYAGTYNDFRKKLFGRAFLSKDGTSLDILWKQWAAEYPEWFQEDLSPADQPVRLAEIIDTLKEDYVSEYGLTLNETVTYAAAELMMEYFELPEVKAQFSESIKGDSLQAYLDGLKKEYHDKYVDYTKYFTDVFKKYPEQSRKQLARQQAKFNQRTAEERTKRLERQAKKKFKDRIIKNTKDVVRLLEDNTDKKHVPEVLKNTTLTFLKSMDFLSESGWNTQDTIQLQNRLNAVYRKFSAEENAEDGNAFMQEIDPDFLPTLNKMIEELESSKEIKKIADLSSEQLKEIDYLVHTLKRAISTTNKLIANERYEMISELGDSSMNHMKNMKAKRHYGKAGTIADDMLQKHMLSPKTYFKQMGEGALSVYNELREGLDKRTWKLKTAEDYMKNVIGDTKINKWTGKKANTHQFEYNGKKFDLTDGQLMNLYVLAKRPQALGHLTAGMTSDNGGFIIDTKSIVKGQAVPERKINISEAQLKEMFEELTPEQKKMADQMQRFLSNDCADWGNEVSMIMYGYKKFGEKTYWPIKTDDNYNKTDDKNADKSGGADNSSLYGIRNLGMTKNLVKNAKNPIVVGDIFDVFTEHVANMANYNAFVVPLTDAMKWFNYRSRTDEGGVNGSIKEEMQRAFGASAKSYFTNFIKDVNGEAGKGVASEIANTFTSKYKAAAVGANIRTVVQQPTSILRVMSVMNPKYLALGAAHGSAMNEMKENSAIAIWKSWGYFETGLGQSMKQVFTGEGTAAEKLTELSMQGAGKADDFAWGVIWNAVKEEIKDKYKDIDTSSEEYKKLVSDRFNEVIDETQVVDTVLHRSQIMRSKNGLVKLAVAFMAEPTKSYNLLYESVIDTYQNNTKENRLKVGRRATVYALTGIATAAAASLVDAFRDDDEEKEWAEKYMENLKENARDNLNPINMIPYLKEIPSFFKGFDASRMDLEGISNLVSAVQQIGKYIEGDSSKTLYGVTKNVLRALSQVTGIPVSNLLRDSESLIEQFMFAPFDENKPTNKTIRIRLLKAMKEGNDKQLKKYLAWYDKKYQEKISDGKTDKDARKDLKSSITSQFKEIYQNSSNADKIKIKQLLLKISVGGKQLYKDYDWSGWDEKK